MDITFLVGNGFDLSMGYKTSYPDFYEWYLKQPNEGEHTQAILRLKEDIRKDIVESGYQNWSDFETGLGRFTKSFKIDEIYDFIAAYQDALEHLHTYLSNLPKLDWLDNVTEKQWDEIRKSICYFYKESHEQDNSIFSSLKKVEQDNGYEAKFHFVSFNYTDFLDKCVEKIAQKPLETWKRGPEDKKHFLESKVFHVHGPLDEYPIVGVSDEDQILNQDFRKKDNICTILIKSRAIGEVGSHRYSEMEGIIKSSRIICLWGLSLGSSDRHWWKYICEWLKADQNRILFIFEYTQNPPSKIIISDLYAKRRSVARKLLRHFNVSDETLNLLLPRIHIIFNTEKVLAIQKIAGSK